MTDRTYTIPMTGVVTVDADTGVVKVEVSLTEVSSDLRLDYEFNYPDEQTKRDEEIVTACLMSSPSNFAMTHVMVGK